MKPNSKFYLKEIQLKEKYSIISEMKSSNVRGYYEINSKTLKLIPPFTALAMTHLINCIIRTSTFPRFLKVAKIIPICKPKKQEMLMSSYHQKCILPTIYKIIEKWFKMNLTQYLKTN